MPDEVRLAARNAADAESKTVVGVLEFVQWDAAAEVAYAAGLAAASPQEGVGWLANWWRPAARWVRSFDQDQTAWVTPLDRETVRRLADGLDAGGASYEARTPPAPPPGPQVDREALERYRRLMAAGPVHASNCDYVSRGRFARAEDCDCRAIRSHDEHLADAAEEALAPLLDVSAKEPK